MSRGPSYKDTHSATGGATWDTGINWKKKGKPTPMTHHAGWNNEGNGEVRVLKPADPEKLKAYRESKEYRLDQRNKGKSWKTWI